MRTQSNRPFLHYFPCYNRLNPRTLGLQTSQDPWLLEYRGKWLLGAVRMVSGVKFINAKPRQLYQDAPPQLLLLSLKLHGCMGYMELTVRGGLPSPAPKKRNGCLGLLRRPSDFLRVQRKEVNPVPPLASTLKISGALCLNPPWENGVVWLLGIPDLDRDGGKRLVSCDSFSFLPLVPA